MTGPAVESVLNQALRLEAHNSYCYFSSDLIFQGACAHVLSPTSTVPDYLIRIFNWG